MINKEVLAYLDDYDAVTVVIRTSFYHGISESFWLADSGANRWPLRIISKETLETRNVYKLLCPDVIDVGQAYQILIDNGHFTPLQYRFIVKTPRFNADYYYQGADLGACWQPEKTVWTLWAPTAQQVILQTSSGNELNVYQMKCGKQGIWQFAIASDCENWTYNYLILTGGKWHQAIDPYGKAITPNGTSSVVVALAHHQIPAVEIKPYGAFHQAVIYEACIRDSSNEMNFKGFISQLDRISRLGVTHIQLMPVTSFATVDDYHRELSYNWGYDPRQPQSLQPLYSSDINNYTQVIDDFRALVKACHQRGLRVNLDMVFNHVYLTTISAFQDVVPYYYFRYDGAKLSNGSMCGNDFDSSMVMARRYIIDTVEYLTRQYNVDGFRFDLMGILDVATIDQLTIRLKAQKPDIMIYGEGWDMPTALPTEQKADYHNKDKIPQVAFFNDQFRDSWRGNVFDEKSIGYGLGDIDQLPQAQAALAGMRWQNPDRTVNYVEAHDNSTLYDKLQQVYGENETEIVARHKLICAAVLLAQGIPFIHSGQESCRTKNGLANTYNVSDEINHLDVKRMEKYAGVENYCRKLIQIRQKYGLAKAANQLPQAVQFQSKQGMLMMHIQDNENKTITVFFNPTKEVVDFSFIQPVEILADENGQENQQPITFIQVKPITVLVVRSL